MSHLILDFFLLQFYAVYLNHSFFCNVSRVSQEEVKKWAESLENLITHECK